MATYNAEEIASTLKAARIARKMSQRELSAMAGVPQSHISKIESGVVDLRLSSLVELARVLELELLLVPRKAIPAAKAIIANFTGSQPEVKAAYSLEDEDHG
jgi:HTH-type transcriptional regulator / antitoxin HipB